MSLKIGVISEPAYVVGTARIGSTDSSAIALPSPIVDPPPIATQQSASSPPAISRAACATSIGTHDRLRADAGRTLARDRFHTLGERPLLGRGQDQRAAGAERRQLVRQPVERAPFEYHAGRGALIDEAIHGEPQRLKCGGTLPSTLTHTDRASV